MIARRRRRNRKTAPVIPATGFCETCEQVCDGQCRARARREAQERVALQMGLRW